MRATIGGQPTQSRGGGRIFEFTPPTHPHHQTPNQSYSTTQVQNSGEKTNPLDPVQLDQLFRTLLEWCPLSIRHRAYLEREGVPTTSLGSLKQFRANRLARQLVAKFGEEIAQRHPLLCLKALSTTTSQSAHSYWTLAGAGDGLLLPATNLQGLIQGMQIRYDFPDHSWERYRWLSSAGKGGTPLSVFKARSGEEGEQQSCHITRFDHEMVVITEGYKKAAAISAAWSCSAISLAGVRAYQCGELLETISALGVRRVALAFDQDKRINPFVQQAETSLLKLLQTSLPHLELCQLEWDASQGKGLDEALKAQANLQLVRVGANDSASEIETEFERSPNPPPLAPALSLEAISTSQQAQWQTLKHTQAVLLRSARKQLK
jgi:hypothetical protein